MRLKLKWLKNRNHSAWETKTFRVELCFIRGILGVRITHARYQTCAFGCLVWGETFSLIFRLDCSSCRFCIRPWIEMIQKAKSFASTQRKKVLLNIFSGHLGDIIMLIRNGPPDIRFDHGVNIKVDQDNAWRLNSKWSVTQAVIMYHMKSYGMVRNCQLCFVY